MKLIMIAAVLAAFSLTAYATPGRTNAKGCHKPKRGSYHCHSTYVAPAPRPKATKPSPPAKVYAAPKKAKR